MQNWREPLSEPRGDLPAENEGPLERFGFEYERGEFPGEAEHPTSAWSAARRSMAGAWTDVKHRFGTLLDAESEETITAGEFNELVGDRDIQYEAGMTRRRAEILRDEHDHHQWMARYEDRPIAEFLGALPPYVADPINLATFPVGGSSFRAATQASGLGGFLRHSTMGGAKVGAATAPLEAAWQPDLYGEVRPDTVALTALAPVAAGPLFALPGRLMAQQRQSTQTSHDVARQAAEQPGLEIDQIVRQLEEGERVDPPPQAQAQTPVRDISTAGLNEVFDGYPGGTKGWISEMFQNEPRARQHAESWGIDPDAPALREFFTKQSRMTSRRTDPPAERRFQQVQDLTDFVRGRAQPEQVQRLETQGLTPQAQRLLEADQTPPAQRRAEGAVGARELEDIQAQLRALREDPEMDALARALEKSPAARTSEERLAVENFHQKGGEGVLEARLRRRERRLNEIDQRNRAGESPERRDELIRERSRLAAEVSELRRKFDRMDPDGVPADELMTALEAARAEAPAQAMNSPVMGRRVVDDPEIIRRQAESPRPDNQTEDLEAFAQERGVDLGEDRALFDAYMDTVLRC